MDPSWRMLSASPIDSGSHLPTPYPQICPACGDEGRRRQIRPEEIDKSHDEASQGERGGSPGQT